MWDNMKNKIFVSLIFLAANASAYTIQGSLLVTSSATVNNGMTVGGQETVVSTLTVKGSAFSVGASAFFVTPGGTVGMNTATPNTAYVFHDNGSALVSGQAIFGSSVTIQGTAFSVGATEMGVTSGGTVFVNTAFPNGSYTFHNAGAQLNAGQLDVTGGVGLYSRTVAQLLGIAPSAVGVSFYCNNCSPVKIVVSTGTSAGNFSDAVGGTFK